MRIMICQEVATMTDATVDFYGSTANAGELLLLIYAEISD